MALAPVCELTSTRSVSGLVNLVSNRPKDPTWPIVRSDPIITGTSDRRPTIRPMMLLWSKYV